MRNEATRYGRLWPVLIIICAALVLIGLSGGRHRAAALDPGDCDVVVGPDESITSIQSAITDAANYKVICVKEGVYPEAIVIDSGRPERTLRAYGNGTPVIDGNKSLPSGSASQQALALVELVGDGTVFDGFEVRHSSGRAVDVSASNITVRNSFIHDNWGTGIIVRGPGGPANILTNVLIENNQIYNNLLKVRYNPVIYRGDRTGDGPGDWEFDVDEMWNNPFWSGKDADLPESTVNGLSVTFNTDGVTSRVYAGSGRTLNNNGNINYGNIGADYSATGQAFTYFGRDILFHEPAVNKWTKYFGGGQFGLSDAAVIDAFQIEAAPPECEACTPVLMSFAVTTTVDIVDTTVITPTITPTAIGPSDLVRFSPTEIGPLGEIITGTFSLYKTAAELNLPPSVNIDALDRTPDGRLLISTADDQMIGSVMVDKEDLAVYDETVGTWSLYFDGDQIPYNPFPDDLVAAWLDADDNIYVSASPIGGSALVFIETINSVARGNAVHNNYGEGLVAGRFSENITLEDNVVYDNYHANLYLNSTTNPRVQRNLVYCTDDPAYMRKGGSEYYTTSPGLQIRDEAFAAIDGTPPYSSGQVIVNNIVVGCSVNFGVSSQRTDGLGGLNGALVANNTFANARGQSRPDGNGINNVTLSSGASYANSSFINNLILQETTGSILRVQGAGANFSTFTVAHNLYHPGTSDKLPGSWFPDEIGRVLGAPNLVGPTAPPAMGQFPSDDAFRLTFDSPALDAGQATAAADDFFGFARGAAGAYDIGAHELAHAARIIVNHTSLPEGHSQSFDFTPNYAQPFSLSHGQQQVVEELSTGTYSVAVAPVAGWTTTAECDDGSLPEAITLGPNETVSCTFTSVQAGAMSVSVTPSPVSVTDPGGLVNFAVHIDNTAAPVTLTGLSDSFFGDVADTGNPALASTDCVLPQALESDDSYDCTFTATVSGAGGSTHASTFTAAGVGPANAPVNAMAAISVPIDYPPPGRIIVVKQTDPADTSGTLFSFTASFGAFSLSHGQSHDSGPLPSGVAHSVTESPQIGWTAMSAICDDGSDPANIILDPDETVTCTFTSVQVGAMSVNVTPSPVSVTDPGGLVNFAVHIDNTAAPVTLTGLSDSFFGDVADSGNPALVSTDCTVPQALLSGGSYDCTFTATVSGAGGSTHASTFTAAGVGPANAPVNAMAAISVPIDYPPPGRIIVVKQTDPADTSGTLFSFTASFGAFSLSHGQSHDSGPLPSGVAHSVTENVLPGWTVVSVTCDDGSDPANIVLDPDETVTCTFVSSPQATGAPKTYYVTTAKAGKVGTLAYAPGDILAYDTEADVWSIHFDASDVGIAKALNDFVIMDDGSILMAFKAKVKAPTESGALLTVMQQDVVRFVPEETSGWFELFFDGSDVDLAAGSEKIDALAWLDEGPNGTLLISTTGVATVKNAQGGNLKAQKEDLLAFKIGQTGEMTQGEWSPYFDGTQMQGMKAENVTSAYVDQETDTLYLTVMNVFTIKGVKGKNNMVLAITSPKSPGDVSIFWNAAEVGFAKPIDGFAITP